MRLWVWGGVLAAVIGLGFVLWRAPAPGIVALSPGAFRAAYLIPGDDPNTVEFYITVQSGEIDNPYTPGLAHYVEHLAWLNAVGAADSLTNRDTNAWTTAEATTYFLAVPAENARKAMDTLAGIFAPFTLPEPFMQSERAILQREYDLRMGENPIAARYESLLARLHGDDPRGRSVLGTPEGIAAMRLADATQLHATSHRPGNAVLIVYGDITAANAQALIDTVPQMWPAPPVALRGYAVGRLGETQTASAEARVAQPHLLLAKIAQLPAPQPRAQLQAQLVMLSNILTSSLPGSLAKPLRYDAQLAQGFDLSLIDLTDQALQIGFYARPDTGVDPAALLAAFDHTMAELAATGIAQDTFDRLHRRWLAALAQEPDPARSTLGLALAAAAQRLPLQSHADFAEMAAGVTCDQMNALLRAIAAPGRRTIDFVTPN